MQTGNKFRRVAVDRRRVRWRQGTGVARYRDTLAQALARMGMQVEPIDDGGDAAARAAWADLSRALRARVCGERVGQGWRVPDVYRLAQRHFSLTGSLLTVAVDDPPPIAHWSHPIPLRLAGSINLYTIHDLIPLDAPAMSGISPDRFARLLERLAESGARFVTVSETGRQGLAAHGYAATCCYQAVALPAPGELPEGLAAGLYFLALGRVEPRKNVERLIQAHRASGVAWPLVFAGPDGDWPDGAERRRVEPLIAGAVRFGWQDDRVVSALVANARAVLMPSLAEGFGLPVVEAMRMGVPAMASAGGAQAEIAGDAALLVDPLDMASIARGIARLDGDADLRTGLIARGTVRAAEFGIESFAERLTSLYERFS